MNQADYRFLKAMIPHHESAISMAKRVLSTGQDPEVRQLAQGIIAAQSGEIQKFRELLLAANNDGGPDAGDSMGDAAMQM